MQWGIVIIPLSLLLPAIPVAPAHTGFRAVKPVPVNKNAVFSYYYREDGKLIDSIPDTVSHTYVIRTSRTNTEFYDQCELDKTCLTEQGEGPIEIRSISNKEAKQTYNRLKNKDINNALVEHYLVEILSKSTLRQMRNKIQDNGKGGSNMINNREYGGFIYRGQNSDSITLSIGPPSSPLSSAAVSLKLDSTKPVLAEYHSHPSGDTSLPLSLVTQTGLVINNGLPARDDERTYHYMQGPTRTDKQNLKAPIGYVFAMRKGKIIIYDNTGIIAALPIGFLDK